MLNRSNNGYNSIKNSRSINAKNYDEFIFSDTNIVRETDGLFTVSEDALNIHPHHIMNNEDDLPQNDGTKY